MNEERIKAIVDAAAADCQKRVAKRPFAFARAEMTGVCAEIINNAFAKIEELRGATPPEQGQPPTGGTEAKCSRAAL